jgi:hypothetical protein
MRLRNQLRRWRRTWQFDLDRCLFLFLDVALGALIAVLIWKLVTGRAG